MLSVSKKYSKASSHVSKLSTLCVRSRSLARLLFATILALSLMLVCCACSLGSAAGGDVAATVNGEEILESAVTEYVQSYREEAGLEQEADWDEFLESSELTTASLREQVIDYLAQEMILRQEAAALGITITDAQIDEEYEARRAEYGTDEEWELYLEEYGYTTETVRDVIEMLLISNAVSEAVADGDSTAYSEYMTQKYEEAKIVINDALEDLPY